MKLYKFLREKLKSEHGDMTWEIGKWYKEKDISLCSRGFHASKKIGQAFSHVQGELLAEVEVKGESLKEDDKQVWSEMKLNKVWKWEKKNSVAISIFSAELCLKNFEKVYTNDKRPREAIEAAKKWIENPTEENESAVRSATWSARSAAWSAESAARSAESAAWPAARSAESAAWSAESAARPAARSAVYKKIYKEFDRQFKTLKRYDK